jgi:hypothetical protein
MSNTYTPEDSRNPDKEEIKARLEYLRGEIEDECISYGEIAELQDLAEYIAPDDTVLRAWAGLDETENQEGETK